MQVDDFDYQLPEELIAQSPLDKRDESRLLIVEPQTVSDQDQQDQSTGSRSSWTHTFFRELPRFLKAGDVLVLNNSRVIPARLYGVKAGTGAKVELLLTQALSDTEWLALAKPAKRLKQGTVIKFFRDLGAVSEASEEAGKDVPAEAKAVGSAEVVDTYEDGLRKVRFSVSSDMQSFLNEIGSVPLPPYIHEPLADRERYQTVYSEPPGSVAAPTAGLHFTPELLEQISALGVEVQTVTLHVGIGTFRPVAVDTVEHHVMHSEWYDVSQETADAVNRARAEGRRVIAVGTTALRTLESATASGETKAERKETDIFIYPGYKFRAIDALITNFHLPRSTLLMLVSAFMGHDLTLQTYELAVRERYRFFSFGDAMFITRRGGLT